MTSTPPTPGPWQPVPELDLARRQIEAVDRWIRARGASQDAADLITRTREARLDRDRMLEVTRREHEAIVRRTQEQLAASVRLLRRDAARRAVVVHRNEWFKDGVCAVLQEHGVEVVARLDNGADAVGACVAEQPDLLLVEDSLPMLSGAQVVRRVAGWSPGTITTAHVGHSAAVEVLMAAGARCAWTRQVPPAEVARELCRLVDT